MKTFVDNICRQVIERHLLRDLHGIFDPTTVLGLSEEDVMGCGVESQGLTRRRRDLETLLDGLNQSLRELES